MRTFFVAWQSPDNRRGWYPVGRLDAAGKDGPFTFRYLAGALRAQHEAGFGQLVSFPRRDVVYESTELFPLFANRVLSPTRPETRSLQELLRSTGEVLDPLELLALAGGLRQTDHLEIFPALKADREGHFRTRFFVHGLRHLPESSRERVNRLREGEVLGVSLETTNPATCFAVQIQSEDYMMLGWAPRYLVQDLGGCLLASGCDLRCQVVKVNPNQNAPHWKLLVQLEGFVLPGAQLMASGDYAVLDMAREEDAVEPRVLTFA